MRVGAVVLARMTSSRLPGKALARVHGRAVIDYVFDRLTLVSGLDEVVLATSEQREDDALVEHCASRGVPAFRGSLDDVLGRVLACASEYRLDAVARVNADGPFFDPDLLAHAIRLLRDGGYDIVTNVRIRTFPYGISAEVATTEALSRAWALATDPGDREHVTRPLYDHPESFKVFDLVSDTPPDPGLRLTIDTPDDLERFRRLVGRVGDRATSLRGEPLMAAIRDCASAETRTLRPSEVRH